MTGKNCLKAWHEAYLKAQLAQLREDNGYLKKIDITVAR